MASIKERVTAKVERVREQHPFVDHVFAVLAHYSEVKGNVQAGAVTYFGFLSFFPILALAFFVVGFIANLYPEAEDALTEALQSVLPGMIGDGEGQISLDTFKQNASTIGVIGLIGVLYSGLGWLSGMRDALLIMFKMPQKEQPSFLVGKGRDLVVLMLIGFTLIVSVALSGALAGFSEVILGWVDLDDSVVAGVLLWAIVHGLAIAATTLLFVAMFKLLATPDLPRTALFHGAVLGAVGFEILKSIANFLIASTKDQPAFQAFGVALILLVWINYFSRVTMYGAAWAYSSPRAEAHQAAPVVAARPFEPVTARQPEPAAGLHRADVDGEGHRKLIAGGAAAGVVVAGAVALRKHRAPG
jgi:membrane protein